MAKDQTSVRSPKAGVGKTPRDRSSDVEVAQLQVDGEYTKKSLTELQLDMRDVRDRMTKLEVKVDHLPSKGFIIKVVTISLGIAVAVTTIVVALMAIAAKLWKFFGGSVSPRRVRLGRGPPRFIACARNGG